jgi:transcription elongation factor GreA
VSIQYLSRLKNRLSNYACQNYLHIPWSSILNPTEVSIFFASLQQQDQEKSSPVRRIKIGHKVTLFDFQEKEIITLILVNPRDSNPEAGCISCLSPLGRQIIGRICGDIIDIKIFSRAMMFRIVRVE